MRIVWSWTPAVLYTLLIWWLSSQTLDVAFMNRVPFQDKGVHFLEYGAMTYFIAFALVRTWPQRERAAVVLAPALTIALGLIDEMHQGFVPGRFSDVYDLLADALGAIAAALAFAGLLYALRSRHRRTLQPT